MGMRIIRVDLNSVDWILERGAFLVASDLHTLERMKDLAAFPMWRRISGVQDLETGSSNYWQTMAAE